MQGRVAGVEPVKDLLIVESGLADTCGDKLRIDREHILDRRAVVIKDDSKECVHSILVRLISTACHRTGCGSPAPRSVATREPRSCAGFIGLLGGRYTPYSRSSYFACLKRKVVENAKEVAIQVCDRELMQLPRL